MLYSLQATHYANAETCHDAIATVMDLIYDHEVTPDEFAEGPFHELSNGMAVLAEQCSTCNLWRIETLVRVNKKP